MIKKTVKKYAAVALTVAIAATRFVAAASAEDVVTVPQDISGDGSAKNGTSTINLEIPPQYYVSIPSTITSSTKQDITYTVAVWGDVSAEDSVSVVPADSMELAKAGVSDTKVTVTVAQTDNFWLGAVIGTEKDTTTAKTTGTVKISDQASNLTAGKWSGTLAFNITFTNN